MPDSYPANATGLSIDEHGNRLVQVNARWVTNIDHKRRHTPLHMMPMEHNVRFSRHASVRAGYRHYDNYAAIEVPFTDAIPSDFDGVMGVPITFLDRFNPDQFEVKGITKSWDDPAGLKLKDYPVHEQVSKTGARRQVSTLNAGGAIRVDQPPPGSTFYELDGVTFIQPYARILIQRRRKVSH